MRGDCIGDLRLSKEGEVFFRNSLKRYDRDGDDDSDDNDNDDDDDGDNKNLIAGELTGDMCGDRKWEWAEEWFEFEDPGLQTI